jgi:DNA-binding NarL/FixJ family response regulator
MNSVLLIDSNTFFRDALRELLHFKFPTLTIEVAASDAEGLRKMAQFHPQLLFLDLQLPGVDDVFSLARLLKTQHPRIVVVLFTSYNLKEYHLAGKQAGVDHIIPKNLWSGQRILALVERILSESRKDSESPRQAAAGKNDAFHKGQQKKKKVPIKIREALS